MDYRRALYEIMISLFHSLISVSVYERRVKYTFYATSSGMAMAGRPLSWQNYNNCNFNVNGILGLWDLAHLGLEMGL